MPRHSFTVLFLFVLFLFGTQGCFLSDSDDGEDPGEPFITGVVTDLDADSRRLLVEEDPNVDGAHENGGNKIWLSVTGRTEIHTVTNGRLEECNFSCFRPGVIVTAWVTGPVAESYPLQGTASRIEIAAE